MRMQWSEAIQEHVKALKPIKVDQLLLQRLLSLIDLTSLNESDTENSIAQFCGKAKTPYGHVAGVCVYPSFAKMVATEFAGTPVKSVTVANFPEGNDPLDGVLLAIGRAVQDGVQEVDVVFPYLRYLAGERKYTQTFVQACKAACGNKVTLKIILETGTLGDPTIIADASFDVLSSGADFVKTSTGKVEEGATLEAAATILLVIKHIRSKLDRTVGLKVSGGISEVQQAAQYLALADHIMGKDWATPATFRIGASRLLDDILKAFV